MIYNALFVVFNRVIYRIFVVRKDIALFLEFLYNKILAIERDAMIFLYFSIKINSRIIKPDFSDFIYNSQATFP